MVKSLCDPNTVPADFSQILDSYARYGYRVIALATKAFEKGEVDFMKALSMPREDVECELNFLGFLIFQNNIKEETTAVIETLNKCNVRSIIATGDNMMTAISVAKNCSIIGPNKSTTYIGELIEQADCAPHIEWRI
jgi:magnesium-transporting ATPase (P-type)